MIDFKTAFDLVDHRVLLGKLNQYKLPNEALSWFASYLRNRKQKVSFNNIISDGEMITDGVQQGSILGPLLFLMFINNLPLYTDSANTDLCGWHNNGCIGGISWNYWKKFTDSLRLWM